MGRPRWSSTVGRCTHSRSTTARATSRARTLRTASPVPTSPGTPPLRAAWSRRTPARRTPAMATERLPQRFRPVLSWALRLVTAGALAVSAFVHADLADRYQVNRSGGLSQGELFQIAAGAAALAALLVLLSARRLVCAFAFGVAAGALAAVLISANYDIGAIGPIPD